jgi:hypothetical protein
MPFQSYPGIKGRVFIPEEGDQDKKHPCADCCACQQCGDDRCRVCREKAPAKPARASKPVSGRHGRSACGKVSGGR